MLSTISILIVTTVVNAHDSKIILPYTRKEMLKDINEFKLNLNKMEEHLNFYNNILQQLKTGKYYIIRDEKGILRLELKKDYLNKLNELEPWELINKIDAVKKLQKKNIIIYYLNVKHILKV